MSHLKSLSNQEVITRTQYLSAKEKEATSKLLVCLAEMEERSLHLEQGYSSLFSYLTGALKYSEPAASRRATCSRLVAKYPQIVKMIEKGDLHLTGLSIIAGVLKEDSDPNGLIKACMGKSKAEIEIILVLRNPARAVSPKKEIARPVRLDFGPDTTSASPESAESAEPWAITESKPVTKEPELGRRVSLTLDEETYQELVKAQSMSGSKDLASAIKKVVKVYLEKKTKKPRPLKRAPAAKKPAKRSRYIPAATKYEHIKRQCCFVSPDGVRCTETRFLEYDHIQPYAAGGSHDPRNVRVLCRAHNRYFANKFFGKDFMDKKIQRSRVEEGMPGQSLALGRLATPPVEVRDPSLRSG